MPPFVDHFFIRQEIVLFSKWATCWFLFWPIFIVITNKFVNYQVSCSIRAIFLALVTLPGFYWQTEHILKKCDLLEYVRSFSSSTHSKDVYGNMIASEMSIGSAQSKSSTGKSSRNSVKNTKMTRLAETLSDEALLEEFMAHLTKEYSNECLLSLMEFSQLFDYLISTHRFEEDIPNRMEASKIKLHESVPKYQIVFNDHFIM